MNQNEYRCELKNECGCNGEGKLNCPHFKTGDQILYTVRIKSHIPTNRWYHVFFGNRYIVSFDGRRYIIKQGRDIGKFIENGDVEDIQITAYSQLILEQESKNPKIRPLHYGGDANPFEPIKIISHYNLEFYTGNVIKYVLRAGKKSGEDEIDDLEKAHFYLGKRIQDLKNKK